MSVAASPASAVQPPPTVQPDQVAEAERAALDGRSVDAARLADAALAGPAPAEHGARAAEVLAAVLARRGLLARSAELHAWAAQALGAQGPSPRAAVALVGAGVAPPDPPPDAAGPGICPSLRAGAEALMARGLHGAVRPGASAAALSDLTRAAATLECLGAPVLLDDSPAALAALVALHRAEPDLAAAVLDRALGAALGGPAMRRRHLLLRGWAAMGADDLAGARTWLDAAGPAGPAPTRAGTTALPAPPDERDELVAVALEAGLARRTGDTRALLGLWGRARGIVLRHAVDLWSLPAVGELLVAAARLGEGAWLAPHALDAEELLATLGEPPLWAVPWHWRTFLAAVVTEDPPEAVRRAARLESLARTDPGHDLAAVLAGAATCWLAVLAGDVDVEVVTTRALALRDIGMAFDAARLAKEAAVRTTDRRTLAAMLGLARTVSPATPATPPGPDPAPPASSPASVAGAVVAADPVAADGPAPPPASSTGRVGARGVLSDREREVAHLLLDGMTHRQIGERLFITPKTVEHHVGRMRQRLGSGSRTELFAALRDALAG